MIDKQQEVRPATILIIDDETYIADAVSSALTYEGYHSIVAYEGTAGLSLMEENPVRLLILDVMMPGPDGKDIFRTIRTDPRYIYLPIIFISASGTIITALTDDHTRFLAKPFYLDELLNTVKILLALTGA